MVLKAQRHKNCIYCKVLISSCTIQFVSYLFSTFIHTNLLVYVYILLESLKAACERLRTYISSPPLPYIYYMYTHIHTYIYTNTILKPAFSLNHIYQTMSELDNVETPQGYSNYSQSLAIIKNIAMNIINNAISCVNIYLQHKCLAT